ncbi:MAG TPA: lysylphosphatidylglycerol synthase domain-containing protein [Caulobacteraceae bacterium]|jgi:putative membrane protein|nr:lysylphosphatidylglycerol synthase domain-containing protein [Caulobacteraceae bacterium]
MIDAQARARATAIVAAVIGLAVATAVIGYFNFAAVLAAMRPIGVGGFLAVVAAQVILFAPLGLAWWLVAAVPPGRSPVFMWGRLMREAASDVLPFSQLGGIAIAVRCAVLGQVATSVAFGSCVVDLTMEIVAQLAYTLFGVVLLADRLGLGAHGESPLIPILAGVVIAAVAIGVFVTTQQRGTHVIEGLVQRMLPSLAEGATAVSEVVRGAYGKPFAVSACLGLHIGSWFGAAAGTWLILFFVGHPLPFLSVVAIESLLFAIRNAAFVVPSALGVQEGAYALLGPLFGLPAEAALALSLLKRARDISIGVPGLLTWQFVESRRALTID